MEGNGTSATAMLVGTPEDVGERPDAATVTLTREEIEEALASGEPLELILTVGQGASTPKDVRVAWQRSDLETVLSGTDAGGITFLPPCSAILPSSHARNCGVVMAFSS